MIVVHHVWLLTAWAGQSICSCSRACRDRDAPAALPIWAEMVEDGGEGWRKKAKKKKKQHHEVETHLAIIATTAITLPTSTALWTFFIAFHMPRATDDTKAYQRDCERLSLTSMCVRCICLTIL